MLKRLPNGQTVSYQPLAGGSTQVTPFDAVFTNMDYNGGPVMPSNTNYMVLWSPTGLSAYPPEYVGGLARYFRDLAHDSGGDQSVESVATQYNDLTGAFSSYDARFGGVLLDRHPYPESQCPTAAPVTNCLTDAQIQQELVRFVTGRHLKTDLSHEYFLLTPPHVESCFSNNPATNFDGCSAGEPRPLAGFCAYHQNTALPTMLFYANDPFDADNPRCQDFNYPNGISDGEINGGLSHEHIESITDPIPNDAWTNGFGANQGLEVGDQCNRVRGNPLGTAPNGATYNQVINGHFYWYQEEWSNLGHTCVQRLTLPARLPTARERVTAGAGLDMTFDASRSTAPGGVADFSWQFNDAFAAQTVEQTTPTITHTFPAAGPYSTGVAVFNPDGLSAGTGGIVTTGRNGFTPAFTVSRDTGGRGRGDDGRTVSFSALTAVSGQPVINYLWEFGDGSTGSGATPTHTYARPGRYTVTAVLFSGVGSAFPGAGAGPIYAKDITVGPR
ncbi:MAG: PKD domain-containing protein [Solirubrobacteraceae bacterium]